MKSQYSCNKHEESAGQFRIDKNSNEFIGHCQKCDLIQSSIFPIRDLESTKEQTKSTLKELMIKEKETNISTLKKLEEFLIEYKCQQTTHLEKIIESIQQDLVYITKNFEQVFKSISNFPLNDYDGFFQMFESNRITQILENKKQSILKSLDHETISRNVFFSAFSILNSFPFQERQQFSISNNHTFELKCNSHYEEAIAIDFEEQNKMFLCHKCLPGTPGQVLTISDGKKLWNDYYSKMTQFCINYKNKLEETVLIIKQNFYNKQEVLLRKLEQTQISFDKMIISKQEFIQKQIEIVSAKQLNYNSQSDIEQLHQLFKNAEGIRKLIDDKFLVFDDLLMHWNTSAINGFDLEKLFGVSDQIQKLLNGKVEDYHQIRNSAFKINFQLLPNSTIKQQDICGAIAINLQGNIVVAGCNKAINVFEFRNGILHNLQQLSGHLDLVFCLWFVKDKANKFLSASKDGTIKIWDSLEEINWVEAQTLKGHIEGIYALISNSNGDQIFSGGSDHSVRCWSEQDQKWSNTQSFFDQQQVVYCVNLNESENKLISCGDGSLILILEEVEKYKWAVFQKINTLCACRLCFIRDDLFAFSPPQDKMRIFKFNNQQKQFIEIKKIDIKNNEKYPNDNFLFPSKYSRQKQVLISKHKNFLNIIRICENDEFYVDQCIDLIAPTQFGTISDDGQYLITWSKGISEIQVRSYDKIISD